MATPGKIEVLVVDDEKVVRDFLTHFLNFKGIEVKAVEDGLQAVGIVKQKEFDLIFAEIRMSKMGGLEVFREVKKLRPEIKFIITSSYAPEEILEQAKKEGVIACIKKPFDIKEIDMILNSNFPVRLSQIKDNKVYGRGQSNYK